MTLADKKLPFTRLVADYLPEGDYDNQEAGWRIHDFPDDAPHCAYHLVGGLAEDEAKFIVDAVNAALRPQALQEDVRGLVAQIERHGIDGYAVRGSDVEIADYWQERFIEARKHAVEAAALITSQQATIQEMAGERARLHELLKEIANEARLNEQVIRADLDEAVRVLGGLLEDTQHAKHACPDPECPVDEARVFLAKHQPKDPADGR